MKNTRLYLILLALMALTPMAWAQGLSGSGTTDDPYLITSNTDWITFAQSVTDGTTYSGQTVKLTADISANVMAGSFTSDNDYHAFSGTFDGDGHTITLALSGSGHGTALFYHLGDATIKNLKVQGNVTTIGYRPATFASIINGNSTISNCWSTVAVSSTIANDWVDGGGFVGRVSSNAMLNMTDCAFHGSVTFDSTATTGGGMVGYTQSNATVNLTNCLYSPSALTLNVSQYDPRVFVSGQESGNINNCYYNAVAAASVVLEHQGIDASEMSNEELAAALGVGWHVYNGMVVPFLGEYGISSTAEWNTFAQSVTNGKTYAGQIVKLTNDISITTTAGIENKCFAGTFDGQGHTITLNMSAGMQFTSLICYADGATFQNLKVDGTINTSKKFCAGFVGAVINNGCTFTNCVSDVTINSSISGDGTHGGLVAYVGKGNNTFEGCAFTGKLLGSNTNYVGGLVGFTDSRNSATVSFTNCVFHPQQVTMSGNGSQTFARWYGNNSGSVTIGDNCYYSQTLGGAQGKQMRSITGGNYVTVAFSGNATIYERSGIDAYSVGIVYGNTLYADNGDAVSLNLSCTPPSGYVCSGYTASAGTFTGTANPYTLTMPNEAVTIQAVLEQSATPVAYIDENGVEQQCTSYTVVTDTLVFDNLPAGWYVVSDSITLDRQVHFTGDAHLILCDGATMNISVDDSEPAPELSIDPSLIFEELGEEDMTMVQVTIENAGNSIGDWAGWLEFGFGDNGDQTADLYYHNDVVGSSIDFPNTNTQEMAIRLPGTAYAGSAMGMRITSVQYYIRDYQSADNNYIFRIYGQGLHNQPGALLAEKTIYSTAIDEWITATFDEEIYMTGQVMWATVQIEQAANEESLSMDGGEYGEESDGNWLSTNGGSFSHCYSAGDYGGAWLINVNCQGELIPATWATLDRTEGAVMGGQIETINLTLNSFGMADGEYNATLIINTNDEDMAHVEIPVFLGVSDGDGRTVNQLANVYSTPANSMVTLGRSNTNNRISNGNALQADGNLTLYGQSAGTGSLTATSAYLGHGISATNLAINGCTVNASSTNDTSPYNGINATNLTINSCTVTATGSNNGIHATNLTINSCTVNASGNSSGISIGNASGYVTINGGTVTTNSICSPTVTLGWSNLTDSITVDNFTYSDTPTVSVKSGQAFCYQNGNETVIVSGTLNATQIAAIGGKTLVPYRLDPVPYIDENGVEQQCTFYTVVTENLNFSNPGWYVVDNDITFTDGITCAGDAHLILCDGKTMNINDYFVNALNSEGSLTLYGQSEGTGSLTTTSDLSNGILAANLTINGCTVTATSNNDNGILAANLTINGSTVTATGKFGILINYDLTINGSNVTATGSDFGIHVDNVTINGSNVTATGDTYGIAAYYTVTINSGTVNATGNSSGISGNVTINGGTVTTNEIYSPSVTLGWSNLTDSITVGNFTYSGTPTVSVKSGQAFYYLNGWDKNYMNPVVISGTLTAEEIAAIAGKTLRPYIEPCATPFDLEVTDIEATTATLHWMGGAGQYQLMYGAVGEKATREVSTGYNHSDVISGLTPNTTYEWKVRGINSDCDGGYTEWSETSTFTTFDACPAPFELSSTATHNQATLSWTGFQESYNVRYRMLERAVGWVVVTANTTTLDITNLEPESTYLWQVQGINCGDNGTNTDWSEIATFTTLDACAAPFDLEVTNISATTATLHWTGAQESYNLRYRTFERAGEWVVVTAHTTTLNLTDLVPETEYEWQVQGIDCDGEGNVTEWSEIATFTTLEGINFAVTGYGQDNGGYYLIASPFSETNPLNITNMLSGNHDLYAFVPNPSDSLEWRNYATDTFNLIAGKGYLYANADTVTLTFSGTPYSGNGEFALVYDSTDARKCWNLVGNPFNCNATLDRPYYVLSADGTDINPEPIPATTPVPPCTAVFVKAVSDGDRAVFSKVTQ